MKLGNKTILGGGLRYLIAFDYTNLSFISSPCMTFDDAN